MNRFFGTKKKEEANSAPTMSETTDNMEKRVQFLRAKIQECEKDLISFRTQIKNSRGNSQHMVKQRAMQVMKRRKMYSAQLDNLLSQQFNLEQVNFNQQGIQDTLVAMNAMKQAHTAQVAQLKHVNVGQVEDMIDDMHDLMLDMEEVNEVMGRNYGIEDIDEAELDAELIGLDEEMLNENLNQGDVTVPSYLPSPPVKNVEEEELRF